MRRADPAQQDPVTRRRVESEARLVRGRPEEGQRRGDRLVDEQPGDAAVDGGGRLAARVASLLRVGRGPDGEQLAELLRLRLQALVRRSPALQRPEHLDAGVRLAEDAEAEGADGHEQGDDQRERDEELRPHRDRDSRDEARQRAAPRDPGETAVL